MFAVKASQKDINCSDGSEGCSPTAQHFLNIMQFSGNFGKMVCGVVLMPKLVMLTLSV